MQAIGSTPLTGDAMHDARPKPSPDRIATPVEEMGGSCDLVLQQPAKADILCKVGSLLQQLVCGSPAQRDDDEEVNRHAAQALAEARSASLYATEALTEALRLRAEVERLREQLGRAQVQSTLAVKDAAEEAKADVQEAEAATEAAQDTVVPAHMTT